MSFRKHALLATLFSLLSGYADVVCVVRYKAFASMMTGNTVCLVLVAVAPERDYERPDKKKTIRRIQCRNNVE